MFLFAFVLSSEKKNWEVEGKRNSLKIHVNHHVTICLSSREEIYLELTMAADISKCLSNCRPIKEVLRLGSFFNNLCQLQAFAEILFNIETVWFLFFICKASQHKSNISQKQRFVRGDFVWELSSKGQM